MNMVEKVAEAIEVEIWKQYGTSIDGKPAARAAIAAMRTPTEAMVDRGIVASEHQSVSRIYRAMIDSALEGEGGE